MYKIYINTNLIIKKALTDLLVNTQLQSVDKCEADLIISEKAINSDKPVIVLGDDIDLPLKLNNLIQTISYSIEKHNNNPITHNDITLTPHNLTLLYGGKNYILTQREFDIFTALVEGKLSAKQLLNTVWKYAQNANSNTVATHINNIRRKIGDDIIKTDEENCYFL